ncbi:MAG: hypothetical protein J6Q92_02880 [Oscillospiraceae bacterium]|nr:hypothetical protein [Oscillospiraceae bacterium]
MKRKIVTALLSLLVALALWTYVVTVVNTDADRTYNNVPVVLQGESLLRERGLMVITQEIPTVSLHLEGNRSDLDKLNSSNIVLTADLSKIYDPGTHNLRFTTSYPGDVAAGAISVLSQNPVAITIEVAERASKVVPVQLYYKGELPQDFIADVENRELSAADVEIAGPKAVVDKIAEARIDVDIDRRTESIGESFAYTLCDAKGEAVDAELITTNVDKIMVALRIARLKEVQLGVEIVDGGGATQNTVEVQINPQTIRVSGSEAQLEDIEQIKLGTIDLREVPMDDVFTFSIKLPEGIENETGVTEATVTVQFQGLETKTLRVSNFELINVPEGMNAKMITEALEVQIRGPKAQVSRLKASNVTAVIDFTDTKPGTVKLNAQITSSVTGVGAVGSYTVSATLKEK